MIINSELLQSVIAIAEQAGHAIMTVYNGKSSQVSSLKSDNSPLTDADLQANAVIMSALHALTPSIPIISEEALDELTSDRMSAEQVWLVDPLDGTKEFLKRNDEFTVNIALVQDGKPVLGVVYAPALDLTYYAATGLGAWKREDSEVATRLQGKPKSRIPIVTVSRSHLNQATEDWLDSFGTHKLLPTGSSLKICYLAEGKADIYPRLAPVMEWDIAAADIVLSQSGGGIIEQSSSNAPSYNKQSLYQPPFVAYGLATDLHDTKRAVSLS